MQIVRVPCRITRSQKTGPIAVAELYMICGQRLNGPGKRWQLSPIGDHVVIAAMPGRTEDCPSEVRKTLHRKVVSFTYGCFQAVEVVREQGQGSHRNSYRSARLEQIVPSHTRYAYDLIAYVGKRCLCESATLKEVPRELPEVPGQLQIAQSSLDQMQQNFLFYLGRLHATAAPVLKDYLSAHPCLRWLVDGTVEPQTPVFFAVHEADEGILLGSWKMPSEQSETISGTFARAARASGQHYHV